MLRLSQMGVVIYRNNVGKWQDKTGRWVRYGLCQGSSDLIGFRSILVTSDMVGQRVAVFVACEVKTATGRATKEQVHFLDTVRDAGGIAMLVRSEDEAEACLRGAADTPAPACPSSSAGA